MKPKEILFVIDSPFTETPGGRENWLVNLAPHLRARGYNVTVLCRRSYQKPKFNLSSAINLVRFNDLRSILPDAVFLFWAKATLGLLLVFDMAVFVLRGYRAVKCYLHHATDEVTLVAMGTVTEGIIVYLIRRNLGYHRIVVAVRGKAPWEIGRILPYLGWAACLIERRVIRTFEHVWANGEDTQIYVQSQGGKAVVIPNGVDYNSFCHLDRVNSNCLNVDGQPRPVVVMSIATLRPEKGIPQLVETIPLIPKLTDQPFKVFFVGAGNPAHYLARLVASGSGGLAVFPGSILAVEIIHEADIMVCLSGGGGMSMSALEAMAAGKAIVAWDTAVYRQLLVNGYSAFLVPDQDQAALARAISVLIENPSLRSYLAKNAQQEAARYDWPQVSEIVDRAIQSIGIEE